MACLPCRNVSRPERPPICGCERLFKNDEFCKIDVNLSAPLISWGAIRTEYSHFLAPMVWGGFGP